MRNIAILFFSLITAAFVSAGDLATFVNLGFSADGSRFVFGQYGVTDSDFRAYADLFCVDVAKNDFISGGKFSTIPGPSTIGKDSRGVFAELQNVASAFLKKQGIDSSLQGRALYVQAEDEPTLKQVAFRDFETGNAFAVTVNALVTGSGASVKSSFYLTVAVTSSNGKETRKTVGLPGFERAGVSDYLIRRIITDASGKSIVFIIEKKMYDKSGNSIRYMVETVRL